MANAILMKKGGGGGYPLNSCATLNVSSTSDGSGIVKLYPTSLPADENYGSVDVKYDKSVVYVSENSVPMSPKDGDKVVTFKDGNYDSENPFSFLGESGKTYYFSLFSFAKGGVTNLSFKSSANASPSITQYVLNARDSIISLQNIEYLKGMATTTGNVTYIYYLNSSLTKANRTALTTSYANLTTDSVAKIGGDGYGTYVSSSTTIYLEMKIKCNHNFSKLNFGLESLFNGIVSGYMYRGGLSVSVNNTSGVQIGSLSIPTYSGASSSAPSISDIFTCELSNSINVCIVTFTFTPNRYSSSRYYVGGVINEIFMS